MPEKYGVSFNSDSAPAPENPPKIISWIKKQKLMLLDLLGICPPCE
jgi:hypothetical protein